MPESEDVFDDVIDLRDDPVARARRLLRSTTFATTRRGSDPEAVDRFLARCHESLDRIEGIEEDPGHGDDPAGGTWSSFWAESENRGISTRDLSALGFSGVLASADFAIRRRGYDPGKVERLVAQLRVLADEIEARAADQDDLSISDIVSVVSDDTNASSDTDPEPEPVVEPVIERLEPSIADAIRLATERSCDQIVAEAAAEARTALNEIAARTEERLDSVRRSAQAQIAELTGDYVTDLTPVRSA